MAYSRFSFSSSPVTNFPVSKLAFNDAKNVLHLAADGGFALLNPACPINGVVAHGGNAARTKIDSVINGGQALVMCRFRVLLEPQIGGITVYNFVIFPDQFTGHRQRTLAGVTSMVWTAIITVRFAGEGYYGSSRQQIH